MHMLWHSCRVAKEKLFADPRLASAPVTVLGRGSRVIGGTIKGELTRAEVEKVLVEGFFPDCPPTPSRSGSATVGLQELGLPYASDPAVSKHLAQFLHRNAEVLAERMPTQRGKKKVAAADGRAVQRRRLQGRAAARAAASRSSTTGPRKPAPPVKVLHGTDLDLAVARGAAYYGLVRRGKGVRIRGGTARAYYVGVETSLPAVPGQPAAAQGPVRRPLRHGGRHRGRRAGPGVRPGGRRAGRVPLPRLDGAPQRHGRHAGRGMGRPDRGAEPAGDDPGSRPARRAGRCRSTCTAR